MGFKETTIVFDQILYYIYFIFIYLTLPINIKTQKIHIWTMAGNTLQLTPITAALTYKIRHHKHIKLITTRYFTGQITGLVTGQTY